MSRPEASLRARCVAELLGTFLLVFFGCGAVHTAVLTKAHVGLWQVAIVWGVAIMVAVYVFGGISGAHINPAITLSLATFGGFPGRLIVPYVLSQLAGAFLAAALLFTLYQPHLAAHEEVSKVVRGEPGSEVTAMCYGEYFPNPGGNEKLYSQGDHEGLTRQVPFQAAFLAEFVGTLILALAVFAFTDPRNTGGPPAGMAPVFIGLTVAILISVIAPLTQACFNPARDFGPRLFAYLAGWKGVAIPGPNGLHFLSVYIAAPVLGAVAGGAVYGWLRPPAPPIESTTGSAP
jgi:glycerol uptake facilitator protein